MNVQNICETTNFFTDYFLSRTEVIYYTLLFRADGRGSKVLTDKFGDSLERMTAVTDRHSAYFALHFLSHQVCLAHLRTVLRER